VTDGTIRSKGQTYETLAICRALALARAAFADGDRGEPRGPLHDSFPTPVINTDAMINPRPSITPSLDHHGSPTT
jgi:hypothetical protein